MTAVVQAADGSNQDLSAELSPEIFRRIETSGMTAEAYLNSLVSTGVDQPTAFEQLADQMGFRVGRDRRFGVRPNTVDAILNPSQMQAGAITRDADLGPRVFFPIYALSVMEQALRSDGSAVLGAYNRMVAVRDTIPGDTYERPLIDFTEAEKPRGAHVAQLSEPRVMVKATVSSKIYRIPSDAIGVEYSDQAAKALGLDFLLNGFARRAEMAAIDRVYDLIYGFLNGDADMDMAALASVSGAAVTAGSLDAGITTSGNLTQDAWVSWLVRNSRKRTINMVLTDLKGALAIQKRQGRPVVTGDNGTSTRIDTPENIVNPMWPTKVDVFLVDDPRWPANTIVGLDTRYGVHHVDSTSLNYQGAEQWAIRRSTKLRFDTGGTASRLYDDAWSILTLTP
jgi:hypothetical protein